MRLKKVRIVLIFFIYQNFSIYVLFIEQGRLQGIRFIWAFIESMLISITQRLNRVSRNYRYVMKVLSKEKRALKGTEGFGMALKINPAVFFGPTHMSRYCFF